MSSNREMILKIVTGGIALALAFVLSQIKLFELPNGGTVTPASVLPIIVFAMAFGPERLERTLNRKTWNWMIWTALMVYTLLKTYSFYTGANEIESIIPLGTPGRILSGGMILPLNICVGIVVACTMYGFYALFSKGGLGSGK